MDYIKLYREILEWEWWNDINTSRLYIYFILKANWKEGKFKGIVIPRGSFVSSIPKLSEETSLTIREVRTAIEHLKSTGYLTCKTYSKFTVFTVKNYGERQSSDTQSDKQVTGKRHSNDMLTTTIEEYKEGKNIKKEVPKGTKKKFEPPSVDDVRAYCQERGNGIDPEYFVDFYKAKDWMIGKNKMKDWKAAIRNWEKMDKLKSKAGPVNKSKNKFDFETKQNYGDLTELEKQMLSN